MTDDERARLAELEKEILPNYSMWVIHEEVKWAIKLLRREAQRADAAEAEEARWRKWAERFPETINCDGCGDLLVLRTPDDD